MTKSALEAILKELVHIKKNGPYYQSAGICFNLLEKCDYENWEFIDEFLGASFPKWRYFSGDLDYPIKFGKERPNDSYCHLNKWEGGYGKKRMQLLNFLIKTAKQELKNWKD